MFPRLPFFRPTTPCPDPPSPAGVRIGDYFPPNLFRSPDFATTRSPAPTPDSSPLRPRVHPHDFTGDGASSPDRPSTPTRRPLDAKNFGPAQLPKSKPTLPPLYAGRKTKRGPKHLSFSKISHRSHRLPRRGTSGSLGSRITLKNAKSHERRRARERGKLENLLRNAEAKTAFGHAHKADKVFVHQLEKLWIDQEMENDLEECRQKMARAKEQMAQRVQEQKERDEEAERLWQSHDPEEARMEYESKVTDFLQGLKEEQAEQFRQKEEEAMRADQERQRAHNEKERIIREEQDRLLREELDRKKEQDKRRKREEQERQDELRREREKMEHRKKEEERRKREEQERQDRYHREWQEAERKKREVMDQLLREKALREKERQLREEQTRRYREDIERLTQMHREQREEIERLKERAGRAAQDERFARERQERFAREQQERFAREQQDRFAREQQERLAREQQERFAREQQERLAREQQERFAREQQERERQAHRTALEEQIRLRFAVYEAKWKELRTSATIPPIEVHDMPWPLFDVVSSAEQVTYQDVRAFLFHPLRPDVQGKSGRDKVKSEVLRFHPDKFNARVVPKIKVAQQFVAKEIAGAIARILTRIMTEEQ